MSQNLLRTILSLGTTRMRISSCLTSPCMTSALIVWVWPSPTGISVEESWAWLGWDTLAPIVPQEVSKAVMLSGNRSKRLEDQGSISQKTKIHIKMSCQYYHSDLYYDITLSKHD